MLQHRNSKWQLCSFYKRTPILFFHGLALHKMPAALKCSQSLGLSKPTHDVLYWLWCHYADWCSHHTKRSNIGSSRSSLPFFCRNFHTWRRLYCTLWWPTHPTNYWFERLSAKCSDHRLREFWSSAYTPDMKWFLEFRSFVESFAGSEGKSCANMAAALDQWTWSYTQNRILLREDFATTFEYPWLM